MADIDSYFIHVKNFTTYFKIFEAPGYEPAFEPEDAYDLRTAYQAIGNVEMPRDSKKLLELMEEVKSKCMFLPPARSDFSLPSDSETLDWGKFILNIY